MGRKPKKPFECPNPLFLKWLEEWRDDARAKGSKLQHPYGKALSSMRKYPLPLQCGKDAMILEGVGESIAQKLDAALGKYLEEHGGQAASQSQGQDYASTAAAGYHSSTMSAGPSSLHVPPPDDHMDPQPAPKKSRQKKQAGKKEYVPGYRTGPYALILTLYRQSQKPTYRGYMNREDLQREAQNLCDTSFTIPDPGTRYTAWSSMSTLTKKGFVIKTSSPARYSITDEGCAMAHRLELVTDPSSSISPSAVPFVIAGGAAPALGAVGRPLPMDVDDDSSDDNDDIMISQTSPTQKSTEVIEIYEPPPRVPSTFTAVQDRQASLNTASSASTNSSQKVSLNFTPEFVLKPGTFDIILCVDFIETTGGANKSRKDALVPELQSNGVEHSVRKLQVGDFLWVAREKTRPVVGQLSLPAGKELVLDYICERKRMDDLNHSIIDGRFREQKFRLRNCGLRHPIYLVEDFGSAQNHSLPESTLQQAIVNTQVIDGFFIKRTRDLRESVAYLTIMTRFLQSFYKDKTLVACPREQLDAMADRAPLTDDVTKAPKIPLLTFQEFSESTVKNKPITVSEMFGKQLMQVSGMSADKAIAILDKYPTPKSLIEAYDNQPTDSHQESMLANLKYGKTQRNLGPSISRLVSKLYCTRGPLS